MKCPNCKNGIIIKDIGQCNICDYYIDTPMIREEREILPEPDSLWDRLTETISVETV